MTCSDFLLLTKADAAIAAAAVATIAVGAQDGAASIYFLECSAACRVVCETGIRLRVQRNCRYGYCADTRRGLLQETGPFATVLGQVRPPGRHTLHLTHLPWRRSSSAHQLEG